MSGTLLHLVLIAQVAASAGMFGVIWVIQLVQYPLMSLVPSESFRAYEKGHQRRITWVVAPLMAVEGGCVLLVFFWRPGAIPFALALIGGVLEAIAIGVTAFISAPTHGRLASTGDQRLLDHLIATNWIRSIAWTGRGALAIAMLVLAATSASAPW